MNSLGRGGVWSPQLRFGDPVEVVEAAAELEGLGFGALWIPDVGGPVFDAAERLLSNTRHLVVATGVLNVWMHDVAEVLAGEKRLNQSFPGRFLLGLGVGHPSVVDAESPGRYRNPLSMMGRYLDELGEPTDEARILAALGPRMTVLGAERTIGVHPFLVPVSHTVEVREALGAAKVVATALSVVVGKDVASCRAIARADLSGFLELPNYTNTWRRLGFGEIDLAGGGSESLIDALYGLGPVDRIVERVSEHLEAGADHVCLRVVTDHPDDGRHLPRKEWRMLGDALPG